MTNLSKLFLCTFLTFSVQLFAQKTEISQLKTRLQNSGSDIEKVKLNNQIADLYKTRNPDSLFKYANSALKLSKKINFKTEEGKAYLNLGNYSIISGNYSKALEYFDFAKNIFEEEKNSENQKQLARAYGSIGIVFSEQSSYDKALEYHLKALKIYESEKDSQTLARIYNNIGIVFKSQNEDFKALEYFTKAQKLQGILNDPALAVTLTNIGNIYLHQNNYPKANEFYIQAENQFQKNPDFRGLGELYNNYGLYFQKTGKKTKALKIWQKAIDSFSEIDDKFGVSDTYLYLGKFYFEQGNYQSALENIQKSNQLSKELNVLETITLTENLLSKIYEKLNNLPLAFQHFKNYSEAKDSLANYEKIRKSVQSEMNYEFEKREAIHREEQQKQEILLKEQTKRHFLQFIFGALLLILCFGIILLFYNRNHLKKTLTLQKNLAEYEQKALHLQMNPHFVFNCLGSISSFIVQNGNDSAIKYLAKFSKLMRFTLEYSKESLIPVYKEIEGLQNYLELEQLRFNNTFGFQITKDENIEDDMAMPPLLIQPFVENAIIHGLIPKKEYGMAKVDFSLDEKNLICTVSDNGIGYEKSKEIKGKSVSVHQSMAIEIIRKRLEIIENSTSKISNLTIEEIKNEKGEISGTKVVLCLPIQYIEE